MLVALHHVDDDSFSLLQMIRLLRAARLLRILHIMRHVEDLRLIISCLLHSLKAFLWTLVLLLSMFSIGLCQTALFYTLNEDLEADGPRQLQRLFGSVPGGVLSLFGGLTSGIGWLEL